MQNYEVVKCTSMTSEFPVIISFLHQRNLEAYCHYKHDFLFDESLEQCIYWRTTFKKYIKKYIYLKVVAQQETLYTKIFRFP